MNTIIKIITKPLAILLILISISITMGATYFIENDRLAYHIDEYIFIRKSEFFELFFINRNVTDPLWSQLDHAQPKIGPYVFGATLYLNGHTNLKQTFQNLNLTLENINKVFTTGKYNTLINYNLAHQFIQYGRHTAIIFSIISFVGLVLFLFHHQINPFIILINLIFISQNFVLLQVGRRALTDSMQLAAFIFGLFFVSKLIQAFNQKKSKPIVWYSLMIGLTCTFGGGVKSSGILVYVFVGLIFLLLALFRKIALKKLVISFTLITITFFSLLIFLHPYTYQQTPRHVFDLFYVRISGSYELQANYPTTAVNSRLDAAWRILKNTLLPFGLYNNIHGLPGLDLALFSTGIVYAANNIRQKIKKRHITFEMIILTFFLLTFISLTFYLRNDWSRYYLPVILAISLIQSYAIGQLIRNWSTAFNRNKT